MYNYFLNTQTIFLLSLKKVNDMKITLLKNYLNNTKGETIDVTDKRGKYLVNVGVGIEENNSYENSNDGTKGITTRKTPEQADKEIKSLNKKRK